jgi:hypothetical protein
MAMTDKSSVPFDSAADLEALHGILMPVQPCMRQVAWLGPIKLNDEI